MGRRLIAIATGRNQATTASGIHPIASATETEGDRRAVPGHRPDARARGDDPAARGWTNPRPLSCGAWPAISASGPCSATSRCSRRGGDAGGAGTQRRRQVDAAADPGDAAAAARRRGPRVRRGAAAPRLRGPRAGRPARARPAAVPRSERPREPRYQARLHRVGVERVEELLDAVDMDRRADEPVRLLSRGMVQRLAVCRAVLHRPRLLLSTSRARTSIRRPPTWSSR